MKRNRIVAGMAVALIAGAAMLGSGVATAQSSGGSGMMGGDGPSSMMGGGNGHGPGMMGGNGHGPGMMGGNGPGWMQSRGTDSNSDFGPQNGPGFQSGRMGMGPFSQQGNLNLSTDDVKKRFEGWLTWQGNPRLKVGEVKEKDAETIEADIVTKDNSLVQRFAVDRHTGTYRQVED